MKSAIIASLIASAAAFAPAQTGKATTSLSAFENELGAQPPLGFFDPLGLLDEAGVGATGALEPDPEPDAPTLF